MDVKNRYASTVMLSLTDPMALPDCTGILLAPRLVLTAGSCVCGLGAKTPGGERKLTRVDASSCEKRILVTSVTYGQVGNPQRKEQTTDMQFHTSAGSIRPHPGLELTLDAWGAVIGSRADLAMIQLDEPMEEEFRDIPLAREEVHVGQSLIMAGYGHDEIVKGFHGVRYYRTNEVVDVRPAEGGLIRYEQQGATTYNGYDGGPCFQEEGTRDALAGIARARARTELVCTSVPVYRDWLLAELQRTGGHPPPP
jgi:Trypsin